MKLSTGLANKILTESSIKQALDGGEIRVYAGPVPPTADAAIGAATLLGTYKAGGAAGLTLESSPSDGTLAKASAEQWTGNAVATGQIAFLRFVQPSDDGSESTTAVRLQLTAGLAGADADFTNLNG